MKFKKFFLPAFILTLIIPAVALAVNFEAGEEIFSHDKTIEDDYYGAGGTVQMESDVKGDLTVAGGRIYVDSTVSGDATLAGGDIILQGEVKDDARLFAGNITISAPIADDLIMGGGNITISNKSSIGGDLIFGGGNVMINGQINGNIKGAGGNVYINSVIKGNVKLYGVDKLTFGPKGSIEGELTYKSPNPIKESDKKLVKGKITYDVIKKISTQKTNNLLIGIIAGVSFFQLLALLFVGLFFVWMLRFYIQNSVTEHVYGHPFKNLGIGFAILILIPIAALISLVTGIGIILSVILMLSWILIIIFGKLIAIMAIGMKIIQVKEKSGFLRVYGAFALGALIYVILTFIPILGWIIKCALVVIGIGAMATYETGLFIDLKNKKKI